MILRPYQQAAKDALREALKTIKRPLVCLPTGSGKTPVITSILYDLHKVFPNEQFVCAVHTQELVEQLANTFNRMSGIKPAVYSSSLRRKEFGPVIFAQIQSIYRKAFDIGRTKLLIVDECDRIPVEGDGQYRTFIKEAESINPKLRVGGFTATPYRMQSGLIYGQGQPFDELVYDADIRTLINSGYLSRLVSKDGGRPDLTGVRITNGDYNSGDLDLALSDEDVVQHAVDEIIKYGQSRKAWLIFCSGVKHATIVSQELQRRGIEAPIIEGNTTDSERKGFIRRYLEGNLRCLININVLSVGFDAPHVDLLALLRPTLSPGLYYQQIGRGLRISPGKNDCLILDLAGNINRHGPIDTLNQRIKSKKSAKEKGEAPTKTCPECSEIVPAQLQICSNCAFEFPKPKIAKHETTATNDSPLSDVKSADVTAWYFTINKGKNGKPDTICVHYKFGMVEIAREYLSPDNNAKYYARQRMFSFLRENSNQSLTIENGKLYGHLPDQVVEIVSATTMLPFCKFLNKPASISYIKDGPYFNVIKRTYEEPTNTIAITEGIASSTMEES